MVDQDKIILMTKIAVYEKRYKKKDERITNYFLEDYIYVNNFITRLGISLIILLFIGVGALKIICNGILFPHSIEEFIDIYIKAYIGPWLVAIVVYTIISSIVYGVKYRKANKRMNHYKELIKGLKEYEG